jgi:hypothetical protein
MNPGVLTQMVVRTQAGRCIGHLMGYEGGGHHMKIAVLGDEAVQRSGLLGEATCCFMDFLFINGPLRKIYIEMLKPEFDKQSSLERLFTVEGTLLGHEFYMGKYADLVIASCTRDHFYDYTSRIRSLWLDGLVDGGLILYRDDTGVGTAGMGVG